MLGERLSFEREMSLLLPAGERPLLFERETQARLGFISFPHVLLEHLDASGTAIAPGTVPATPDQLKTSFYDASQNLTAKDTALQQKLGQILGKRAYRSALSNIAVSVVDLSGARKFQPAYAGHNDRLNFYAASTGKVIGLLAAYQLLADARDFLARHPSITKKEDLVKAMAADWQQRGIAAKDHPDVANVLVVEPGPPAGARLRARLIDRFNDISHGNVNGSTAFVLLKFPYIASAMLAHGLFSPADRSGLWARRSFGPIDWIPWNGFKAKKMSIDPWGRPNPYPGVPSHSVTAASISQFMTLAAQGRMIDRKSSAAILTHLQRGGCVPGKPNLSSLSGGKVSVKCGIYNGYIHMPLYFKSSSGPREFVISILTRNYAWDAVGVALFNDLLTLVP